MAESRSHYEVLWVRVALNEFADTIGYIAHRNPERAQDLRKKLESHIRTLSFHPQRGRLVPETMAIGVDIYRELILAPYRVVFRLRGRRVYIMGFFDGRRDLEELLLERLTRS